MTSGGKSLNRQRPTEDDYQRPHSVRNLVIGTGVLGAITFICWYGTSASQSSSVGGFIACSAANCPAPTLPMESQAAAPGQWQRQRQPQGDRRLDEAVGKRHRASTYPQRPACPGDGQHHRRPGRAPVEFRVGHDGDDARGLARRVAHPRPRPPPRPRSPRRTRRRPRSRRPRSRHHGRADHRPADHGPADHRPADHGPADDGSADHDPADVDARDHSDQRRTGHVLTAIRHDPVNAVSCPQQGTRKKEKRPS